MSAPRPTRRTAALVATAGLTGVLLFGLGPAAADPPALNFDPCANSLQKVTEWPGTLSDGTTLFSDPYEGYLLRQPACNPAP
jgi:hypothetical protein